VTEPPIDRDEIVALLFDVADIAAAAIGIETLFERKTMAKRKTTKAERDEFEARRERTLANARRTRELAERAQAKLDAERRG
jgi:hypothetical protein